jgi:glycine/D-amino acid oxidase-like deaminating enzyme
MTLRSAEVVICGAGIAGIATAYHLAVVRGMRDVVLVDERPPLTLTSDKSTECYRNWWPGPGDAMVALMNRSIDLLEEQALASGNVFQLNRRGYLYATADPDRVPRFVAAAEDAAGRGAGPARFHAQLASDYPPALAEGFTDQATGTDVIIEPSLIRRQFPFLAEDTVAVLHARRCGWFSGQQLGMYLLERARAAGVTLIEGRVAAVDTTGGRVRAVTVATPNGTTTLAAPCFVNAAGPFVGEVARLLGVELPVFNERHAKFAFNDVRGALPRSAPLVIWADPVTLPWSDDEQAALAASAEHRHLLAPFPPGVHTRPEGSGDSTTILLVWAYDAVPVPATFPPAFDPAFPELALRGMSRAIPALAAYLERLPRGFVDGGYYTKTPENRLLAGPLPVDGAYVLGALSGYGLMAANGAAELVAAHVCGERLPAYAAAFGLARYGDAAYRAAMAAWGDGGQL